jgi:hypothetical protein
MSPLFQPKGDKPEWRMVYDELLEAAAPDTIISYEDIQRVLGRDIRENRAPIYAARRYLGEMKRRWLEPVPTVGYRVTQPEDHLRLSHDHKRRSRRQLNMAITLLDTTDLAKLPIELLAKWDAAKKADMALWAVFAHESRIRRIEDVLRREGLL